MIMETRYWKIRAEVYPFPESWERDEVVRWVNTDIKVCPFCNKVDAGISHFEKDNK